MRIGINASFARKGDTGIGQVTLGFLRRLSELQADNPKLKNLEFLVYLEEDLPADLKLPERFRVRKFLPLWKRDDLIRKIWWEKYLLPRKAKKDGCDIFISLYQSATVFKKGTKSPSKHVMVVHDIIPEHFPEYLNNFRKAYYWKKVKKGIKGADRIIAVSRHTEKDLIQHWGIDAARINVAYPAVAENYRRRASQVARAKVLKKYGLAPGYLYAAGGLEKRKNIDQLIRTYKTLDDQHKTGAISFDLPPLVISGKLRPKMAPLILDAEKLVRELNLSQKVRLLDHVPQADMPALYAAAKVFVYPSLSEGFGLPVLEAMSQGVPVVASKTTAIPEVGLDSVLYFNPREEGDLEMVLRNILANDHLRETLKERGIERSRQFSWDKFLFRIFDISREMAKQ